MPVAVKVQHRDVGQIANLPHFWQVGNLPHVAVCCSHRRPRVLSGHHLGDWQGPNKVPAQRFACERVGPLARPTKDGCSISAGSLLVITSASAALACGPRASRGAAWQPPGSPAWASWPVVWRPPAWPARASSRDGCLGSSGFAGTDFGTAGLAGCGFFSGAGGLGGSGIVARQPARHQVVHQSQQHLGRTA